MRRLGYLLAAVMVAAGMLIAAVEAEARPARTSEASSGGFFGLFAAERPQTRSRAASTSRSYRGSRSTRASRAYRSSRSARTSRAYRTASTYRARRAARVSRSDAGETGFGSGLASLTGSYNAGPRPRAWCGWWMRTQLGGGPEYNLAWNWSRYGSAASPQVGAVVVWRHHVGMIVGEASNGRWLVRSGNWGGRVATVARSISGAVVRI